MRVTRGTQRRRARTWATLKHILWPTHSADQLIGFYWTTINVIKYAVRFLSLSRARSFRLTRSIP